MFRYATGLIALGTLSLSASASVLVGPIINPANAHTYYLLNQNTWSASEAEAVGLGGHLATVNDAAEDMWIFSTFSTVGGTARDLWVGLNKNPSTGTFEWVSGEPVTFTHWAPNQPDNNFGIEGYVHYIEPGFSTAGQWNDYPNDTTGYGRPVFGVVEVVPEPSIAGVVIGALTLIRRRSATAGSSLRRA